MELKEYIQILKTNKQLFWKIIIIFPLLTSIYFYFCPVNYIASLNLNITRSGSQETIDYKYDDFYRLQADEKFAETLVQWLKSPRIVTDIYQLADIKTDHLTLRQLKKSIQAEKVSPQLVAVSFSSENKEEAEKISEAVSEIINRNTEELNREQEENTWFKVIAQNPVIKKNTINPFLVLGGSILGSFFLAFWIVMGKYYWK